MKKILYTFLAVSIIFSACKKESLPPLFGCTDFNASNYNPEYTHSDSLCTYPTTRVIVTTVDGNGQTVEGVDVFINNTCSSSGCWKKSNENGIAEFVFQHTGRYSLYDSHDLALGINYKVWGAFITAGVFGDYEACGEIQLPYYNTIPYTQHNNHDFNAYITLTSTL